MANLDVAPQGPVKLIRKYKLIYLLKNGDIQELDPTVTQEGFIDAATAQLNNALASTATNPVSKITIVIGNNTNTSS